MTMLLDELAKELVEGTSALVGGRTINIMNPEGIIIASAEPDRIGSYHQGAKEAAQTGKVVNIYRDQLERYPGAKEGCNMPLRLGGSIIGVVGIHGDPDKIQDVAHLLEVYASKCYQMEAMLRPRMAESAMRIQLLLNLISPSSSVLSAACNLIDKLNIRFQFPIQTVVISAKAGTQLSKDAERLHHLLDSLGFQQKHCDIWGIVEERMVLLCSECGERSVRSLRQLNGEGYRVSIGSASASLYDIQTAYDQASILDSTCPEDFNDIQSCHIRCHYLLSRTASQEQAFLADLKDKLQEAYGQENSLVMLDSVTAYYDCGRSVTGAAARLFIHKNTLQYRIKRVLDTLELGALPPFDQEYLIRLLWEHCHRKSKPEGFEK